MATNEWPILIVDDEEGMRIALTEALTRTGYKVAGVPNGFEAVRRFQCEKYGLVITDVRMEDGGGMTVLKEVKRVSPQTPVVLITAYGTIDNAVEAMKAGATDYILKPFSLDDLVAVVRRALRVNGFTGEGKTHLIDNEVTKDFVVRDSQMRKVVELAESVASSKSTVLIQGESGTGKELVAKFIHERSPRKAMPFVAVNCAAIPENLLESELFGHEKGSFTGAVCRKAGKFELAHLGTILLDEISEMELPLQAKLLRVLQEFEIDRVGGKEPIRVDVRVLATTNKDLKKTVQDGTFRGELYYRLNVIPVRIPSLRERKAEIPLLTEHFMAKHWKHSGSPPEISEEALVSLTEHSWPGNVRELENVIERALLLCRGGVIAAQDVFLDEPRLPDPTTIPIRAGATVREMEQELIVRTLEGTNGNRTHAARALGISVRTLRNKLREYRCAGK
jgi:DNA-binding NtrC family response regulator